VSWVKLWGRSRGSSNVGLTRWSNKGSFPVAATGTCVCSRSTRIIRFLGEFKSIVSKTCGVEGALRKLVSSIPRVCTAIIYGSYAKGTMRADSDIDILVVCGSEKAEARLLDNLTDIERLLHREMNCKLYSRAEFERKRNEDDPFLEEVLSGPHITLKDTL
jgi:predicted nucleotidyltransferase